MNIRSNVDRLVSVSVMGQIASPGFPGLPAEPYRLDADGKPFLLPTYGGIVYNVSVGDSAYGWLADNMVDGASVQKRMQALATLGDPYSEEEIAAAPAAVDGKTEMDAVVAYLQGLGHARSGR